MWCSSYSLSNYLPLEEITIIDRFLSFHSLLNKQFGVIKVFFGHKIILYGINLWKFYVVNGKIIFLIDFRGYCFVEVVEVEIFVEVFFVILTTASVSLACLSFIALVLLIYLMLHTLIIIKTCYQFHVIFWEILLKWRIEKVTKSINFYSVFS